MITVSRLIAKRCPFVDELDIGTLTLTCPLDAPELHDLARLAETIAADPISHEDFTRQVVRLLPPGSEAVWTTQTGPWSVEVREGDGDLLREPVERPGG